MAVKWQRTSASQINKFMKCQRSWELSYLYNLERDKDTAKEAAIFGSAFHTGLAYMLEIAHVWNYYEYRSTDEANAAMIEAAVHAAHEYLTEETRPNVTIKLEDDTEALDQSYYDMMQSLRAEVANSLSYYIPLMGIGTRYKVMTHGELFADTPIDNYNDVAVELEIDTPLSIAQGYQYRGYVDAILRDLTTGEIIVVDWKTRKSVISADEAMLDNQLHIYAAMLQLELDSAPISQVCMWQFKRVPPKPARMNKNGSPSVAAQATTIDVWYDTLPAEVKQVVNKEWESKWREFAEVKLSARVDFMFPVFAPVTDTANKLAYDNFARKARMLKEARIHAERGHHLGEAFVLPAAYTATTCKMCEFRRLCVEALRYGDDPQHIIEEDYRIKGM